jgi:hypothetical protein
MEYHNFLNLNNVSMFEDVKELLENNNINVKEDGNLYLIYYKRDTNKLNTLQHECNGMILEKNTNKIICNSYNKFYKSNNDILSKFKNDFDNIVIENCIEGTLLRLYYYNGTFRVATKKCINSNYINKYNNYYELFEDAIKYSKFKNYTFEKNKVYFFLLKHPNNVIIFNYKTPELVHLETFKIDNNIIIREEINRSSLLCNADSYEELSEYINNQTLENIIYQGIVIYHKKYPMLKQRFYFNIYEKLYKSFGQQCNPFIRFIELRNNINLMQIYLKLFPDYKKLFFEYEHKFITFASNIHKLYLKIKVEKKNYNIQKNFKKIIYDLHGIYLKNRIPITITIIIEHLMTLDKNLLGFLFNDYEKNNLYIVN